jgi:adenylate cyclase
MRKLTRSPAAVAVLIGGLVGLGLVALKSGGVLEGLELAAYDGYVRLRSFEARRDERIVLVPITERDIQQLGSWPVPDAVVARALEHLGRHGPRAIGVDIYRDVPVPPGTERLAAVLSKNRRIVAVMKFGGDHELGVRPPPALANTDRVGFNDILADAGGTVRRGLLFLDDGTNVAYAFALRLALLCLEVEGLTAQPDPVDVRLLRLGRTTIRPLEPNDGAYVRADVRGYQFLLDFVGGPMPFSSVSFASLVSGTVDPAMIVDKVVLIGVTAESVKDTFYTPLSRGVGTEQQMPGVAVHAHIVSQLLRIGLEKASPVASPRESQETLWTLLWSGAVALVAHRLRSPWRLFLVGGGGLLSLVLIDFLAFTGGWWWPLVPPALAWITSMTGVTAYTSYHETMQRAQLMQLFSRHVSREVAETIWQQRDQFLEGRRPRPQRLIVTALFSDLTSFTPLAERLPPEELMDWLNEYMGAMAQEVSKKGGVIEQYEGDAIVAVFGVPVPRRTDGEVGRDAVQAVRCALAMGRALGDLNRRWQAEQRPTTGMRIGIFTGPAVAGTLGSSEREEYVVVGDTINTAARLESFDKTLFAPDPATNPCRILIGETTLGYLGLEFVTEKVGEVVLKGKEHRINIYRVLGDGFPPGPDQLSTKRVNDEWEEVDRV